MKRVVALCVATMLFGASPASAQTFTPMGTYLITGTVTVSRGISMSCILNVTLTVPSTPSSTALATPQFLAGASPCPSLTFTGTPYTVTYDPVAAKISMSGIMVGGCSGTITGTWNNTTKILLLNSALTGTPVCTVNGQLTAPGSLNIF